MTLLHNRHAYENVVIFQFYFKMLILLFFFMQKLEWKCSYLIPQQSRNPLAIISLCIEGEFLGFRYRQQASD